MRSHQSPKPTSPEGKDPHEHVAGSVEEIHRLNAEVFADAMDILLRGLYEDTSRKGPVPRPPYGTVIDVSRHALIKERTSTGSLQDTRPLIIGTGHDGHPAHEIEIRLLEGTDDSQGPLESHLRTSDGTITEVGLGLAKPEVDPGLYLYSGGLTSFTDTYLAGIAEVDG